MYFLSNEKKFTLLIIFKLPRAFFVTKNSDFSPFFIEIRQFDPTIATKEIPNQYFNSSIVLRDKTDLNWVNEDHKISKNNVSKS